MISVIASQYNRTHESGLTIVLVRNAKKLQSVRGG